MMGKVFSHGCAAICATFIACHTRATLVPLPSPNVVTPAPAVTTTQAPPPVIATTPPPPADCHVTVPAACNAAAPLASFESLQALSEWSAGTWAEATAQSTPSIGAFGATDGAAALEVPIAFSGQSFAQGYVGMTMPSTSFAGCGAIGIDVTLPADAPSGITAQIILLLGPDARWSGGVAQTTALAPGATTTVTLDLAGTISPSPVRSDLLDVRGVGVLFAAANMTYSGAVALDRLQLITLLGPGDADRDARSVGLLGGFVLDSGVDIPARNGYSTYVADATLSHHAWRWPRIGAGDTDLVLGAAEFPDAPGLGGDLAFDDWVTAEVTSTAGTCAVRALLSRAFPAIRYSSTCHEFSWVTESDRVAPTRLAYVRNGEVVVINLDQAGTQSLAGMSEPWLLVWAGASAGWSFQAPVLITLQNAPVSAATDGQALTFAFSGGVGAVNVLALRGLMRLAADATQAWDSALPSDIVAEARSWVPLLAAFPIRVDETASVDEQAEAVTVTDTTTYENLSDAWGTVPQTITPLPPMVYTAGVAGYPVSYATPPIATPLATFFGPFAYANGAHAQWTIPFAEGLARMPVPLAVTNDATAGAIHDAWSDVLVNQVASQPGTYWLANDVVDAKFMCDSLPALDASSAAAQKAQVAGPLLTENAFLPTSMTEYLEPVTGQHFLAPSTYPDANQAYDKEWNIGRQLAGLASCAENAGLDLARGMWPKILESYRYNRIFFDWATGSVLSSCLGVNELADGMNFAFEGMLGVGRLAKHLGDTETYHDVAYRSARQSLALFGAWQEAAWLQTIDYGIGHITQAQLPAAQIETRGAIDGFFEETGAETLELQSFWETTNWLYFDNAATYSLYRHSGLVPRVRTLEYDIMPALHPSWADGTVMDPVDQRYYGSNYTSAHLVTRAVLFGDDPAALFALYNAAQGTPASQQWYTMFWQGLAGATLLGLERARAPVVEVPRGDVALVAASYDAMAQAVSLTVKAWSPATAQTSANVQWPNETARQVPIALCGDTPVTVVVAH
jgi:hypothetical protein